MAKLMQRDFRIFSAEGKRLGKIDRRLWKKEFNLAGKLEILDLVSPYKLCILIHKYYEFIRRQ
jgi:hypothetical protein